MAGGLALPRLICRYTMNIDFLKIRHNLLKQYNREHPNNDPYEFIRGMVWMEEVLTRILEKNGHVQTTERQMLAYLEEQLLESQQLVEQRDREIHRLKQQNKDLRRLSKKDLREWKKDINVSTLCKDNRKLLKERDLYLSRLHSTRTGDSPTPTHNKS